MDLRVTNTLPTFKGSHRLTEKGNTYYHANTGVIATGVLAGSVVALTAGLTKGNVANRFKNAGIAALISSLWVAGGALTDFLRNRDNKFAADEVAEKGFMNAKLKNEKLKVSKKGGYYIKDDIGETLAVGATVLVALATLGVVAFNRLRKGSKPIQKKDMQLLEALSEGIAYGAAGLPLFGPLAGLDFIANYDAKKNA